MIYKILKHNPGTYGIDSSEGDSVLLVEADDATLEDKGYVFYKANPSDSPDEQTYRVVAAFATGSILGFKEVEGS